MRRTRRTQALAFPQNAKMAIFHNIAGQETHGGSRYLLFDAYRHTCSHPYMSSQLIVIQVGGQGVGKSGSWRHRNAIYSIGSLEIYPRAMPKSRWWTRLIP